MSKPIIKVENLSKKYIIGHQRSKDDGFRHVLEDAITRPISWLRSKSEPKKTLEEFYALNELSFEVRQGEVLGVIGRNGAGKSTLLKVLSRITEPTSGRITLNGRVASLLEVGTGFHPELTGRENIFLNGAILGMTRSEIKRKFDEIVEFSEVDRFLDTPVKRYSSGMYVRLAFAVAAHLEPEILIVDEVLAVGDVQFQKKCMGKMGEISEKKGSTVLFVSHNMSSIAALSTSCLLLGNGKCIHTGDLKIGIDKYLSSFKSVNDAEKLKSSGNGQLTIDSVSIKSENSNKEILSGTELILKIDYTNHASIRSATIGFTIFNQSGNPVTTINTQLTGHKFTPSTRGGSIFCRIPKLPLNTGEYWINTTCFNDAGEIYSKIESALVFSVTGSYFYTSGKTPSSTNGSILIEHNWSS